MNVSFVYWLINVVVFIFSLQPRLLALGQHGVTISYLNLIDRCFVFNCFRNLSISVLSTLHVKNISPINVRHIKEIVLLIGIWIFFKVNHKDVYVWGCVDCSPDTAFYLQMVFAFKDKVAEAWHQCCKFFLFLVEVVRSEYFFRDFLID